MASFGDRFVGALRLDIQTFEEVEHDPTAMGQAIAVVVIAAVAEGIGSMFSLGSRGLVGGVVGALIGYAAWSGLVYVIGTKVMPDPETKADFAETFRVIGFAAAPGVARVLGVIPLLGLLIRFVVWLWMLVAMVVAVQAVLDYRSSAKAIAVCLIGFIVYLVVVFLLVAPIMVLAHF
jgi:hypothetical protein